MPPPSVSPPTPVVEMMPLGHRQPERVRRVVDVAPGAAAADAHGARRRIDADALHARQVDDQPVVAHAEAAAVVAAAAHREQQVVLAREVRPPR